jgi:hypothetical protein
MDVLPRLKLLNASHLLLWSPVGSFTAKLIYLHEPVQGLNLNRQSISGLEPEMSVTLDGVDKQQHDPAVLTLGKGAGTQFTENLNLFPQ